MVWATIITKEHSAKLLYNVFRHFCSKSNLRWQHLWILLHAEMINRKELTIRLKQKGLGWSLYFCQSNLLGEWTYIQQEQSKWELAKGGSPTLFEDERMSFRGCSFPINSVFTARHALLTCRKVSIGEQNCKLQVWGEAVKHSVLLKGYKPMIIA